MSEGAWLVVNGGIQGGITSRGVMEVIQLGLDVCPIRNYVRDG